MLSIGELKKEYGIQDEDINEALRDFLWDKYNDEVDGIYKKGGVLKKIIKDIEYRDYDGYFEDDEEFIEYVNNYFQEEIRESDKEMKSDEEERERLVASDNASRMWDCRNG